METDLLSRLTRLETDLHREEVRSDAGRLDGYPHDEFLEIGRSGRLYDKQAILKSLPASREAANILARDFCITAIKDGLVLLIYESFRVDGRGARSEHARRSSLWQRTDRGSCGFTRPRTSLQPREYSTG